MSRQRREKKARDKELARQMDTSTTKEGVTQERLTENGRITDLKWRAASWNYESGKRSFWQKEKETIITTVLFLVERHRHRLVGHLEIAGTLSKKAPSEIPFEVVIDEHPLKKISYARPAHFFCFCIEGSFSTSSLEGIQPFYEGEHFSVQELSKDFLLEEMIETPSESTPVSFEIDGEVYIGAAIRFSGIHRTKTSVSFPIRLEQHQTSLVLDVTI
ncbi:MAG: hypothetical protein GY822_30250 [Deltaproteobacteria bacterium]|nr:hypothetical protein [Deltaproteobacteria bacterium]